MASASLLHLDSCIETSITVTTYAERVMKSVWSCSSSLVAILIGVLGFAFPVNAQWRAGGQWRDASGDLVVTVVDRWGRSCASGTAQASYRVSGGSSGLLYPDDCNGNSGRFRFEDTGGRERCLGTSIWKDSASGIDGERETIWIIEASVPGFACSTVGQTYSVKLYYSAPPPAMTRGLESLLEGSPLQQRKEDRDLGNYQLQTGLYYRASYFIGIYQHEDRFCYVGISRNGRLVASLSEYSERPNTYYFDGSDDGYVPISQLDENTLSYGVPSSEYRRELGVPLFGQLPSDLQSCLLSLEPYYESDEPPRR